MDGSPGEEGEGGSGRQHGHGLPPQREQEQSMPEALGLGRCVAAQQSGGGKRVEADPPGHDGWQRAVKKGRSGNPADFGRGVATPAALPPSGGGMQRKRAQKALSGDFKGPGARRHLAARAAQGLGGGRRWAQLSPVEYVEVSACLSDEAVPPAERSELLGCPQEEREAWLQKAWDAAVGKERNKKSEQPPTARSTAAPKTAGAHAAAAAAAAANEEGTAGRSPQSFAGGGEGVAPEKHDEEMISAQYKHQFSAVLNPAGPAARALGKGGKAVANKEHAEADIADIVEIFRRLYFSK